MITKCLFYELWILGLQWDYEVPAELATRFKKWMKGLELLKHFSIGRRYDLSSWLSGDQRHILLHVFGDASERGYGAVVYIFVIICLMESINQVWLCERAKCPV